MQSIQQTPDVMSRIQTAQDMGISTTTLSKLDIPVVQIRRRKVYRKIDVDKWLESQKIRQGDI
jgi:hypothetical protein